MILASQEPVAAATLEVHMPPAASPAQGSRAGLITGLVVAVIIAVSMIVVAVYMTQKLNEADRTLSDLRDRDKPLLAESDITDPRVLALSAAKDQPQYQGLTSAMQIALAQSDQLSKLVGGNTTPDRAADVGRTALNDAGKRIDDLNAKKLVSTTLPKDNLITAISSLTDQVSGLATDKQDRDNQLKSADAKYQQLQAAQKAQLDDKDKLIQAANAKADDAAAQAKTAQDAATQAQQALAATANGDIKKIQDANAALTSQLQAKDKALLASNKAVAGYKTKLHQVRTNPSEPIIQHPDGNIIRVGENKTAFINLGKRQHVTTGLTFEIYDKEKGIPPLGDGLSDGGLPVGKGSIEVFNVGPDTSECRIIKLEPGQELVVGDLIANLVYDPTVKYNFVVYGDFDLSGNGIVSPTDAEIVKRLVTQWGGAVQDHVSIDTDFIVVGSEPVVHPVIDPNNANDVLRNKKDQEKRDQYQAVIASAGELSIPVMNQNRFLYFIGYYDQASR
jgi:hypothetical protein